MDVMKPKKAICESDLGTIGSSVVPTSGHIVKKVVFSESTGIKGSGFYKKCDPTYPPILAKYVVGISQLYRSSLGSRASEERLVYDDAGENIIGTVSLAIPKFIPMSAYQDSAHTDKSKELLATPSVVTLVDYDVASLLVSSLRHREDDLHPGNISVHGRIDFDMSWYFFMHVIKGAREVCGTLQDDPVNGTKVTEKDFYEFPITSSVHTHWPTRAWPGNGNILKFFNSQPSFVDVKDSQKFRGQMFKALLKELLSFQPEALAARLNTQLGSEDIRLNSLVKKEGSKSKKDSLLEILGSQVFYRDAEKTIERKFSDHFLRVAKNEYEAFYHVVVCYPEFRNYLISNPDTYLELRNWFDEENSKYPPEEQYNLDLLDQTYQKIWKDTAYIPLCTILGNTKKLYTQNSSCDRVNSYISKTYVSKSKGFSLNTSDSADGNEVDDTQSVRSETSASSPRASTIEKLSALISDFHSNMFAPIHEYLNSALPTPELQKSTIQQCRLILLTTKTQLTTILDEDSERRDKTLSKVPSEIASHFEEWASLLDEIDFERHVKLRKEPTLSGLYSYRAKISPEEEDKTTSKPIYSVDIDNQLQSALIQWLDGQSKESIAQIARNALRDYVPHAYADGVLASALSWLSTSSYSRKRAPEIEKYIKKALTERKVTASNMVVEIFTTKDSWYTGSFNTFFLQHLLNNMLDGILDTSLLKDFPGLAIFASERHRDAFDFYAHISKVKHELTDGIINFQTKKMSTREHPAFLSGPAI
jgi:hypothetical protein